MVQKRSHSKDWDTEWHLTSQQQYGELQDNGASPGF